MPRYGDTEFEIDTLIHRNHTSSFSSRAVDFIRRVFSPAVIPADDLKHNYGEQSQEDVEFQHEQLSCKHQTQVLTGPRDITVKDEDLSAEYEVKGILPDEIPVIGTFIDKRIVPGFRYQVRILGTEQCLFQGKALTLQSIGMGYGKRITFEGNPNNNNYFYSDTQPDGFGFKLVTIAPSENFMVNDFDVHTIAEGTFNEVSSQRELSMEVESDGTIIKRVLVCFSCDIKYSAGHGYLPLQSAESFELNAVSVVVKPQRARRAHTKCIEQLEIPSCGSCTFEIINPKMQAMY